ncbi:hypothetical protein ACRBEV_29580 [Methylobacterium phyllosphaerae]
MVKRERGNRSSRGKATDAIRDQLQFDISGIFCHVSNDAEIIDALRRVSKSARALNGDLQDLAQACLVKEKSKAEPNAETIANDVTARLKFARQVLAYAEGAEWTLDKGYRAFSEPRRGRPTDTKLLAWATALVRLAQRNGWTTEDSRGRTSAELTELMFELSECARAAGATHGRDRRSLTRALAQARSEELEDAEARKQFAADLDALGSSEP